MADEKRSARRRAREEAPAGADFKTEPSPYGNAKLRNDWAARADKLSNLGEAVSTLIKFRADNWGFSDQDALWIEARLEERVAVLRMQSVSDEEFRTRTLLGEDARQVCADVAKRAAAAGKDYKELERINDEFRSKYKPPVMPTNLFMPAERDIAELLQKSRSIDWKNKSEAELRAERGVVVHSAPAN